MERQRSLSFGEANFESEDEVENENERQRSQLLPPIEGAWHQNLIVDIHDENEIDNISEVSMIPNINAMPPRPPREFQAIDWFTKELNQANEVQPMRERPSYTCQVCFFDITGKAAYCYQCDKRFCGECYSNWVITSIQKMYVKNKVMENITCTCLTAGCKDKHTQRQIESSLDKEYKDLVHKAMTVKLLQSLDENYVACPNKGCKAYGFPSEGIEAPYFSCQDSFQCAECNHMWKTKGQLQQDCYTLANWLPNIYEMHSLITIYKLTCGESCPQCNVIIVHTGGCKYMKCEKCSYEFCWWCLDEFYTEYHFHFTDCPFRYWVLHGIEAILAFVVALKIMNTFPIFLYALIIAIWISKSMLYGFSMLKLSFFVVKRVRNVLHYQRSLKEKQNLYNVARLDNFQPQRIRQLNTELARAKRKRSKALFKTSTNFGLLIAGAYFGLCIERFEINKYMAGFTFIAFLLKRMHFLWNETNEDRQTRREAEREARRGNQD